MAQRLGESRIARQMHKVMHLFHKPKTEMAGPSPERQKELDDRLLGAIKTGSSEDVGRLLKAKADANAKDKNGWTALMYVQENDAETAKLLI
jgi:ankyrin repeat protein